MLDVRHARADERDEIANFMNASFPRAKWGLDKWHELLAGRWADPEDPYAIIARSGDTLVGALGLISVNRPLENGGVAKTRGMTSWYMQHEHRGGGIGTRMMDLATSDPAVTITNQGSAPKAVPVLERAGLSVLETERLFWKRHPGEPTLTVHADPLALGAKLSPRDRSVLMAHRGLNLTSVAVETPDGLCVIVFSVKQKRDGFSSFGVMYLGDRALFTRHARAIAASVLRADGDVMAVDKRFVTGRVTPDETEPLEVPYYYTAGLVQPADIDHLFSEVVLLDMKIY